MKHISEMNREDIKEIKLIVFDVDGVLVKRGTKIEQGGGITTLETKKIASEQIEQIRKLNDKGFYMNINSGRGLYMLQEMFRDILPFTSLTYENGSASWVKGKLYQHVNSFEYLKDVLMELKDVRDDNIKGFEPKELIITLHCKDRVKKIEEIVSKYPKLSTVWNGEAYDIIVKKIQTKAVGLHHLMELLNLKKENVLVIGDNYNDAEMMAEGGIAVSADKDRVEGDFFVEQEGDRLPADMLMRKLLELK